MTQQDYKDETKNTYNTYSSVFKEVFSEHFNDSNVKSFADQFLEKLAGKKILDLGCGPGIHAEYFREQGFEVLCVDISENMINICKEKGFQTLLSDIEGLNLPENSFDGVWAYTSLLHLRKSSVPDVIKNINGILKDHGIFGLALKEGSGERFEANENYPGTQRWFSYYQDEEFKELLRPNFNILNFSSSNFNNRNFLNYVAVKK